MPVTLNHAMPDTAVVARTLTSLCGKPVTCRPGKPFAPAPKSPVVVATYVEAGNKLAAVLVADLGFAAGSGAALVMLPPVIAQECIQSGKLNENIDENLREVLNVGASLFNSPSTPRVTLGAVTTVEKLSDAVAAFVKAPPARLDLEVAIPGYPSGKLSLLTN